jgi:DnaJ-domain-containing protein 1
MESARPGLEERATVGVLDRIAAIARSRLVNLAEGKFGVGGKRLADLTDAELEEELLRRRRVRAARRSAGAMPLEDAMAPSRRSSETAPWRGSRSVYEQQIAQYYANLELQPGAPLEEVRRAYRELMARYHPDKHVGDAERHKAATELAQSLTRAYTALVAHLERR